MERLFIVGKLIDENNKIQAFKLYYDKTGEGRVISKEKTYNLLKYSSPNDLAIIGLKRSSSLDAHGYPVIKKNHIYNIESIDRLNGKGEPLEETNKKVVIGFRGFLENREYKVVDSRLNISWLSSEEFKQEVRSGNIIGATQHKDKILIYYMCKTELKEEEGGKSNGTYF